LVGNNQKPIQRGVIMGEVEDAKTGIQNVKLPERVIDGKPTMYGFQTCPFCWKIRALLRYKEVEFREVEVDPMKKKEISWSKEWKKVPIYVESDGTQVNDSNDILHWINKTHTGGNIFQEAKVDPEQDRWMDFSNDILGKSIVAVIYRTYKTSRHALRYVSEIDQFSKFSAWKSVWLGGIIMKMVGKSRAKMFEKDPEENLQYQLDVMSSGISGVFFGGDVPNGADFANFGILRSMQGLNGFQIVKDHKNVSKWYKNMQDIASCH